ncbi:MAG TPA: helicase C-terminal domain-containing protein [Longimicrobiales bacterium]|nr:helicase C-terminal domain-containing protein [Longimicrobiales bacterium]
MPESLTLVPAAAKYIRAEIAKAKGNEVCFVATLDEHGAVASARAVARGHRAAVLAAVKDAEPGQLILHNHPSGQLDPSNADLEVAARLYEAGLGFAIVDNNAHELYVVLEPPRTRALIPLDVDEIAAALAPGGPVSFAHHAYEDRPTQRDLAVAVARAYNDGGVAVLEAGTGTGKSVAYLIPAIKWALQNRERTVISTNTINLQEQLVRKDLPFLRQALGEQFRFALVKGRGNYISIRRAKLAEQTQTVLFEEMQQNSLSAVLEWLKTTTDGSLQDLPFTPPADVWEEVVSDSDVCLRAKCPHFEQCFYQKARRDAAAADVLVANHSLLFSDLAVRRLQGNYTAPAVLPPYKRVILDEAHNLEDAATEHLGATVTRRGLLRILNRLDKRGKGLLSAFENRLMGGQDDILQQDALRQINALRPALERARENAGGLFQFIDDLTMRAEDGVLRLLEDFATSPEWAHGMDVSYANLLLLLDDVARKLGQLRDTVLVDRAWSDTLTEQLVELHGATGRVQAVADGLRLVFGSVGEEAGMVRWLERRGGREVNLAARAAPVEIAEALREALFDRVETSVMTSATLATRDGFSFVRGRLGVTNGLRVREAVFPSPFDYEEQTLIVVPTDLPAPGSNEDHPQLHARTAEIVLDFAEISDGGLFVLFTSYRALKSVAASLRRSGIERRWPLFVQGEAARGRLLESFVLSGRGVLLGVSSFWEGVDVPGDPLRGIILTKLPFKVPTEPLTAARIEAIERNGGSSFMEYVLPHAALRLKQGFGRLIRATTDRGAVAILDRRILEKGYGRYFLGTLPSAPVVTAPWIEASEQLLRFYSGKRVHAVTTS